MEVLFCLLAVFISNQRYSLKDETKIYTMQGESGMIDIHTHILPGLDDGADDFEEACIMAEMAVRSGVTALIATPHSNDMYGFLNEESIHLKTKYKKFCQILKEEQIPLEVYRGMEIWASSDISEKIETGRLLTLNQSKYVLIEFSFIEQPWWFETIIHEMTKYGLVPVIAHPERYESVQENPNLVYDWYLAGACTQMNKGSLLGRFGRKAAYTAEKLLKHQLYSFIASDAHHYDMRTTDMNEIVGYLKKYYDEAYWIELLEKNPLELLKNREIRGKRRPMQL